MPNRDPWNFVVIGCGRMGIAHTRRLIQNPRAKLIGCFDLQESAAVRLRDQFINEARVFGSFDEAISAETDAVVIATPTGCHHDHISAAVAAGRHVLAEKPLAGNRSDISNLVQLAETHSDLHCVLGYQLGLKAV